MSTLTEDSSPDNEGGLDIQAIRRKRWLNAYELCRLGVKTAPGERPLPPPPADELGDDFLPFLRDLIAPDYLNRLADRAEDPLHPRRYRALAARGLDPNLSRQERKEAAWAALARAWQRIGERRSSKPWWNALTEEAEDLVKVDEPAALDPDVEDRVRVHRELNSPDLSAKDRWLVRHETERRLEVVEPPACKVRAFRLRYFDGWKQKRIAEEFDKDPSVISRWISDVEEALRDVG